MARDILDVNSDEFVQLSNKLETYHKSVFPSAVRETLNSLAFHMKGGRGKEGTLMRSAKSNFEERDKRFFKRSSVVNKAEGFDIEKMDSEVGFSSKKIPNNPQAVENLDQQEEGGTIKSRSFIPLQTARTGKSQSRKVKKKFRIGQIDEVVDAMDNPKGTTPEEKFTLSALEAGKGGFVLGNIIDGGGNRFLMHIKSIKNTSKGLVVNSEPVYVYQENRSVTVKGTDFVDEAAKQTGKKMKDFFKENARRQIERAKMKGQS